ncbi:MAG TPA: DNA double-strand break repair nuclease NurA [Anaerolineales bacterium]|jgi:hypothetical protein
MPVDYQQIHHKIKEIGAGARQRRQTLDGRRKKARELLNQYAADLDSLRLKVDAAKLADPNLRCALPVNEPLDSHHPAPESVAEATLIAADGSQVNPDRHAAVLYSLINIGAIVWRTGLGSSPQVFTYVDLAYGDELYTDTGMISEDLVALGRDLSERKKILELALRYPEPVITLTDGPIELWGAEGSSQEAYRRNREIHLSILSQLQSRNVTVAGYVDKPAADLVVRLLEISRIPDNEMKDVRRTHGLRNVTDRWLFGEEGNPLLQKGERSAIFVIQSSSRNHYEGDREIRFFYLNVGNNKHPWIARVEIPAWVAENRLYVNTLHSSLLQQCAILELKPYPYVLARAHEIAVVKFDDKKQVELLLQLELGNNGEEIGVASPKQTIKGLQGRTRM